MSQRSRSIPALVAAALVAAGLSACSTPEASPGVTDDTITIGTHTPLTGPAAAGYSSISAATKAYFDYVNDNGGINGRSIEYVVKDDGYNPATTQTVVRELVQEDEVFAVLNGLGTPTHSSVVDYLNENEVPDLFVASGSPQWDQPEKYPWTFAYNARLHRRGEGAGHLRAGDVARQDVLRARPGRRLRDRLHHRPHHRARRRRARLDADVLGVGAGRRRADRRHAGGGLRGQLPGHRQRVHRPRARHRRQDEVPGAVGVVVVRRRLPDAGRLPRRGRRAAAAPGLRQLQLPAVQPGRRVGRRCSSRSTTSTTAAPSSAGTPCSGCRSGTCSRRRSRRPARTRRARACSTPSRWATLTGNGIVPLSFSKDSHAAFEGVGITVGRQGRPGLRR